MKFNSLTANHYIAAQLTFRQQSCRLLGVISKIISMLQYFLSLYTNNVQTNIIIKTGFLLLVFRVIERFIFVDA